MFNISIIIPTSIISVLTHNKYNSVDGKIIKSYGIFVIFKNRKKFFDKNEKYRSCSTYSAKISPIGPFLRILGWGGNFAPPRVE